MLNDPMDLRANIKLAQPYCSIGDTVFDHVTSGSWLNVTMASTILDPWGQHDAVNTEFINVAVSGVYMFFGGSLFPANATGQRGVRISLNASTIVAQNLIETTSANDCSPQCSGLRALIEGDTLELEAFQNSTGTLSNLTSALSMVRVSG